jgi:hypothetical protein
LSSAFEFEIPKTNLPQHRQELQIRRTRSTGLACVLSIPKFVNARPQYIKRTSVANDQALLNSMI